MIGAMGIVFGFIATLYFIVGENIYGLISLNIMVILFIWKVRESSLSTGRKS